MKTKWTKVKSSPARSVAPIFEVVTVSPLALKAVDENEYEEDDEEEDAEDGDYS